MSTFLNRFSNDVNQRIEVNSTYAGLPVLTFHDGLGYDETTPDVLVVTYTAPPVYFQAGIGFTAAGEMCVFDASAGLPADTFWQSGLPIKEAENRLCVDPTNAVLYVHQGVPFTTVHAVAVNGSVTPPVECPTFTDITIVTDNAEGGLAISQLSFGDTGTVAGYYTNKATFLADHPGMPMEPFTGIAPPAGTAPVPGGLGFSAVNCVVADFDAYAPPNVTGLYCSLYEGLVVAAIGITFDTPVNSAGFNLAVDPELAGLITATIKFYDGVTLLDTQTQTPAGWDVFTSFAGYSLGCTEPPGTDNRITADSDTRITADSDTRVWV